MELANGQQLYLWLNVKKYFQPLDWSDMTEEERDEYCRLAIDDAFQTLQPNTRHDSASRLA